MIDIAKKEIAKLKKHVDIGEYFQMKFFKQKLLMKFDYFSHISIFLCEGKIFKLNNSSYSCVYENEVKSDISIINWPTNLTKTVSIL